MKKEEKEKLEKETRLKCWIRDTKGFYGIENEIPKKGYVSLHEAYKYCSFYNIFTDEEKIEFLKISDRNFFVRYLDWVHIDGRKKNKYNLELTCLGNRLSHSFFDSYQNPSNGKLMTKEERDEWKERLKEYIKRKDTKK